MSDATGNPSVASGDDNRSQGKEMNEAFLAGVKKQGVIVLAISLFAIFSLRQVLWGGWTYEGDPTFWYAFFQYFSNSLYYGHLPLWNPYMNGGEPFWPVLGLWRLLDPVNVSAVLLAKLFGYADLYHLYKCVFFFNSLLCVIGVSILIFQFTKRFLPSFLSSLLFTNFYFTTLSTDFNYATVYVYPFALVFWIRFVESRKSRDFLIFAYLLGLYIGSASYHAISGIFMLLVAGGILFVPILRGQGRNFRSWIQELLLRRRMLAAGALLVVTMSAPFIVSGFYQAFDLFPIARVANNRVDFENPEHAIATYDIAMKSSAHAYIMPDTLAKVISIYPEVGGRRLTSPTGFAWFVDIVWIVGVAGALLWRRRMAWPLLSIAGVAGFLTLGPSTPVHRLLTTLFPPLILVRNTFDFESFIFIFLAIMQGIGWAAIEAQFQAPMTLVSGKIFPAHLKISLGTMLTTAATVICVAVLVDTTFDFISPYRSAAYIPEAPLYPDFDFMAHRMRPLEDREFAMARTGWFLLDPILYRRNTALQMLVAPPRDSNIRPDQFPYYQRWQNVKPEKNRGGPVYGLREIFWTKEYATTYKAGERDVQTFENLLAVNQRYVDFQQHITPQEGLSLHDVARLTPQCAVIFPSGSGSVLSARVPIPWTQNSDCVSLDHAVTGESGAAVATLVKQTPSAFEIKVDAPSNGIVVVHDSFDAAWRAVVDGKPTDIYKINLLSKGVFVSPGQHTISLVYRPWSFLISVLLFYLVVVGFPLLLLFEFLRGRLRRRVANM